MSFFKKKQPPKTEKEIVKEYLDARGLIACKKRKFGNNGNFVRYTEVEIY